MTRSENQKAKLFYLFSFLSEQTDEKHPVSMQMILQYLADRGITAERKSIYDDIRVLTELGCKIVYRKEQPSGYYLAGRNFSQSELKMLTDAVSTAVFLSPYRKKVLHNKISGLGSRFETSALTRPILLPKAEKEPDYRPEDLDPLYEAIRKNRKIRLEYADYRIDRGERLIRTYTQRIVSPYEILFSNGSFFLLAFDEESGEAQKLQLERIRNVLLLEEERSGEGLIEELLADFGRHFAEDGTLVSSEMISLAFSPEAISAAADDLGNKSPMRVGDDGTVILRIRAVPDDTFFAWVLSYGDRVRIKAPLWVVQKFARRLDAVRRLYNK